MLRPMSDLTVETAVDVVIVGGGLVGMTLAAALGHAGVSCAVIDGEDPATASSDTFDGRVFAIALSVQRMMAAIGLWPLVAETQPIEEIRVSDGASPLFLHYDHRELGDEPLGHMVENRMLRRALYRRLAELPAVTLLAPMRVARVQRDADGVVAELADGHLVRGRLCVAADGRDSPLRRDARIKSIAWRYRQSGIVCTVAHEKPHRGIAHERFLPAGPFAILPMTGNRSSLVWTEPTEHARMLTGLPADQFHAEMRRRFGDFLGATEVVGPRWSYPLAFHHAERYIDRRLALVGDAAHLMHPIAGQGLNAGLRDIAALAEAVVNADRLGLDIGGDDVLRRYQRWRHADNTMMLAVTDVLNRLFSNDIWPIKLARDVGLAAVNRLPPLRLLFMRHAMGTVGHLPRLLRGEAL